MKAVILAGGLGTRLAEETRTRPKPMAEIGGKPILWHILKIYGSHGINDFIICCGHLGYQIKEYFANYFLHTTDVTMDLQNNTMVLHEQRTEPWRVTLVDTGADTLTGGRLKRVEKYLNPDEPFFFTYGDGVADVDLQRSKIFHNSHGKCVTMTTVRPPARFGAVDAVGSQVTRFIEKPLGDNNWINGGFFVLSPKIFEYLDDDSTSFENAPLVKIAAEGELMAFKHSGFWQPMDTLRDKNQLEQMWANGAAPWKTWSD